MQCYESDCKSRSGADAFPSVTLSLCFNSIRGQIAPWQGTRSKQIVSFSLPLLKDFATIDALAKNKLYVNVIRLLKKHWPQSIS